MCARITQKKITQGQKTPNSGEHMRRRLGWSGERAEFGRDQPLSAAKKGRGAREEIQM
jgi:hypothetical protein